MAEPGSPTKEDERPKFNLVQEIASSINDSNQVPERYIHKNGYQQASDSSAPWMDQLLIDLSLLSSSSSPAAAAELQKLRSALTSWGCFQVINHGMTRSFLNDVLQVCKEFFALPLADKQKCSGAADLFSGYGNDAVIAGNQILNWNDRLYLTLYPEDQSKLKYWPQKPKKFREIVREYGMKIKALPELLLKAMARSLDLEENCFLKQHKEQGLTARVNLYPRCGSPDRVLGVKPHSDGSTITILLQDNQVEGLQVLKDDQWFKVPFIPNALFVNAGDLTEVMSNGIFKSTVHRVVTNSSSERVSLAVFYSSNSDNEIGPANELVTADRPCSYKKVTMKNYGKLFIECYPRGQRTLNALKF
ncbi:hypothetical protein Nepgr_018356 [Nepenthes gracilis]|uniref:Fe2OG dioxygenase domain-containing protein n=1 Tax=Nepenthes gracilis TaxID=150966 RepID=A0AAD3XU73_NEPGR|nr:hypothetical protein Nepgr_018356 [Nepenthes gracilis]